MGMDMVTKGVHNVIEFLSDDSPDMDVIGISEFRDPRFYPSLCESLPSIATIGGLTEAARLGTSQAELKDGTTRAPIVRFLSCQRVMKLTPS
ncbi:hypothetical protein F2Q69_00008844 [Brassica cretica]|uniref:Uncharacterized protein n=1 Tax=Brassica cretica TaxID=69181 RepID=A0A8S9NU14_BRACR|nr:hypothetical protein F2Q69_00008844 [Brassica cretica]